MPMKRALLTALCVTISACNSSSFQGAGGKQPVAKKPEVPAERPSANANPKPSIGDSKTDAEGGVNQSETFSITQNQGMIDVVWVIDNSGSMSEEAAQVRKNFEQFVDTVQSQSDMKIALLSKKLESELADGGLGNGAGSGLNSTGVTMPAAALSGGGRQVDSWVGSNDPLSLLAISICAADASKLPGGLGGPLVDNSILDSLSTDTKACGKQIHLDTFELGLAPEAPGKLHDFFRPQAKKVFVIVSDDNAEDVNAANFLDLVKPDLGGQDPVIFGFVGLDETRSGCKIAKVGSAYEELAFKTGGAVFDICDADWSANFGKLSANVAAIAQSQFTVKAPKIAAVTSATIDGKPVPASAIRVSGAVVTIDPAAIPAGAKSMTILYKRGP